MQNDKNINSKKEQWIGHVMASTEGMQRALPPGGLYEKIILKTNNPAKTKVMPLPAIKWAAAAILLLTLNIGSLIYASGQNRKVNTPNPIAAQMQLEPTYNY